MSEGDKGQGKTFDTASMASTMYDAASHLAADNGEENRFRSRQGVESARARNAFPLPK